MMYNKLMFTTVSVTGSLKGMTGRQELAARARLRELRSKGAEYLVHGDAVGADAIFDTAGREFGYKIITFPSNVHSKRAYCAPVWVEHRAEHPLKRNPKIVKLGDILLVAPSQMTEIRRSGTWTTKRHAERFNKKIEIFYPDGSTLKLW